MYVVFSFYIQNRGPGRGGSSIPYPINFFKKYPISLKTIRQLSPNIRKLCIPLSQNLIKVSLIPLFFYKNIPYPSNFLANIPISLNTLPGPQNMKLLAVLSLVYVRPGRKILSMRLVLATIRNLLYAICA